MKALTINDNDIIHLKIGGQKLPTKRSTLSSRELPSGNHVCGRWEESLERDQDGAVFLHFNPQYFVLILDYLRTRKISLPGKPIPLPKAAKDQLKISIIFISTISDEFISTEITPREKFNLHSPGITVDEIGTVAVHGPDAGHKYILGENVYQRGIVNFKLKLESFQNDDWIFVGIAIGHVKPPHTSSHRWRGLRGWRLSRYGKAWRKGGIIYG